MSATVPRRIPRPTRANVGQIVRRVPRLIVGGVRVLLRAVRWLLACLLWLLRGWAGLIAGALVALAIWLGPAGGARWIAAQATTLYWHVAAALTRAYQTAYDAAALPAAAALSYAHALGHWDHYLSHFPHAPTLSWHFWMRHGAAWRYAQLQRPGAAAVRALLPWEIGGAGALAALLVGIVLLLLRRRGLDPSKTNTYGGARWQTWAELKRRRARRGDLILGTARRRFRRITVGVPKKLLVEGVGVGAPNGLGKSNAFYKAQLLEADPDIDYVVTDPKGEHWEQTAAAMSRTHDVYRLDMLDPANSVAWAPLALERTPAQAEEWAAAWLLNARPKDSAPAQPYFEQAIQSLIAAGIDKVHAVARAAGREAGTLDELLALLLQPTIEKIAAALTDGPGGATTAVETFLALIAEHRDLRTSIPSGLAPRLGVLTNASIKAVVGGDGALDLDRLGRRGRRPVALYIVTPVGERILRPLVGALFNTIFRTLMDRARTLPGKKLEREVRLLLDEFGTMGAIPDAPDRLNTCRQVRISRVLSWQLRSQMVDDYGEPGAEAIVESCNALAWLGGTRDKDAQWASDIIGKRTVLAYGESATNAGGGGDRSGHSASETGVPLLFPEDLLASSRRRVVVSVREARPMDLRTRPVWDVRAYRRLMKLPAPIKCYEVPVEDVAAPVATPATVDALASVVAATTAPAVPLASTKAPKEPKTKTPTATTSSTPPTTSTSAAQGWTPATPTQPQQGTGTPVKWTTLP